MSDLKDKVEDVAEAVAHEADLLTHPEDETKKEAKARQPWMPIVGAAIAAIILLGVVFFFII